MEHELKYVVASARAPALAALLGARLVPDPRHPEGIVESLYFDTYDLELLREKLASDYRKTKVRLRWYPGTPTPPVLELKRRLGTRRAKLRLPTGLDPEHAVRRPLDDPGLAGLPRRLRERGVPVPERMVPLLTVRYHRRRWVDPAGGARISLDTAITVSRVHPHLAPPRATPLASAVLEVKGREASLPPRLAAIAVLGPRRSSFSKYAASYEHLTGLFPAGTHSPF